MGTEAHSAENAAADNKASQPQSQTIYRAKGAPVSRFLGSGRVQSRRVERKDKTLAFFLLALQGSAVVLELRNNVFVRGMLYMADIYMNMFLSKVKVIREGAEPTEFEWMYVKARTIRMLHLDKNMDFKAFVMTERAQQAAQHAQRKVSMLSSNPAELIIQDNARPAGF